MAHNQINGYVNGAGTSISPGMPVHIVSDWASRDRFLSELKPQHDAIQRSILGYSTLSQKETMFTEKDFLVIDSNATVHGGKDNVEDAKALARELSSRRNSKFFVLKPIFAVAPKKDLEEKEL